MATKSSVRKSVLHNSNNSSGTYRPCGSVNFAAGTSDDERHSTSTTSTASSTTVDTAAPGPCDHLRRYIEATAVRLGCRGRRVQAVMAAFVAVVSYELAVSDLGMAVHRLCGIAVTVFSVACCFCVLALYLRDSWSNTAVYVFFATCFGAEIGLGHVILDTTSDSAIGVGSTAAMLLHPLSTFGVLAAAGVACLLSPLDASGGTLVIALVSLCRYLAATMLADLPSTFRPLLAYAGGLAGVVGARYIETLFLLISSRDNSPGIVLTGSTSGTATVVDTNPVLVPPNQYGRMPDIKRRRSSSAVANNYSSHCHGRRISLPTLVQKSLGTTVVLDGTLVREAEGLLADMMADPELPRHLLCGLRAVSNMLKTTDTPLVSGAAGGSVHRAKTSPVVSLSECSLSSSAEYNDLPYADRPIYLPKRLRRSLPSTLSRCRSAGTWTTTTSATGMPSLESEPAPRRAKVSLGGRSESGATGSGGNTSGSPQPKLCKRLLTSDYESSDSPSSSEVGDPQQQQHQQPERDRSDLDLRRCSSTEPPGSATMSQHGSEDTLLSTPLTFCLELDTSDEKEDDDGCSPEVLRAVDHLDCSTQTTFSRKNSSRSTHITFADEVSVLGDVQRSSSSSTLDPVERQLTELRERLRVLPPTAADLSYIDDDMQSGELLSTGLLIRWDYPVFDLAERNPNSLLSRVAYKLFSELGFISTFNIPVREFVGFFHALELGYRDKPYHNRLHATDVLHAVWYMTTQPVPGFMQVLPDESAAESSSSAGTWQSSSGLSRLTASTNGGGAYGVVGTNFPALELMALYTAAAMHDYDHPGRTNAFLVTTGSPLAVLYNDRSVLENHHAAAAWRLLLSDPAYSWLQNLDYAEFKRFRFLVIEAVLATDLKRHFDLLSEFNAKVNDAEASGIDWTIEADRLMVSNMIIKMADINGPCKPKDLHLRWTDRITEEFYEQGDEEASLGLPISPYMNRRQPQLAKLQESFINHLVAPLCNALSSAGLLPGVLLDESEESDVSSGLDDDDIEMSEDSSSPKGHSCPKPTVSCTMVQNLEDNHEMWVKVIEAESQAAEAAAEQECTSSASTCRLASSDSHSDLQQQQQQEMEPIREEETNSTPTTNTAETTMADNTLPPVTLTSVSTALSSIAHAAPTDPVPQIANLPQPAAQVSSSVDAAEASLNKR